MFAHSRFPRTADNVPALSFIPNELVPKFGDVNYLQVWVENFAPFLYVCAVSSAHVGMLYNTYFKLRRSSLNGVDLLALLKMRFL